MGKNPENLERAKRSEAKPSKDRMGTKKVLGKTAPSATKKK